MKALKWIAYINFTPAHFDSGFKQWIKKGQHGILLRDGALESFLNKKEKIDLGKHDFIFHLQLRDYYNKKVININQ